MQKKGYFYFYNYYDLDSKEYELFFWCLKIDNDYFYGKNINEFLNKILGFNFSITLFSWNLDKIDSTIIKKALFKDYSKLQYIHFLNENEKPNTNYWKENSNQIKNKTAKITIYNKSKVKTFLSIKNIVAEEANLSIIKWWNNNIKKEIENDLSNIFYYQNYFYQETLENQINEIKYWVIGKNNLSQKYYGLINKIVNISEEIIEINLKILNFNGRNYRSSLVTNSLWWWQKNNILNVKNYFSNKIKSYYDYRKLKTAIYGNYNYINEKYFKNDKKYNFVKRDKNSAFAEILVNYYFPCFELIKCNDFECNHLSILNVTYKNFLLKPKKLPIFFDRNLRKYLNKGQRFEFIAIKQMHQKINQNYYFESKMINWRICFEKTNAMFQEYFKYFYYLKEKSNNLIIRYLAKKYCAILWASFIGEPLKSIKYYEFKENKRSFPKKEKFKIFLTTKKGYWIERIYEKSKEYEKHFDSWKTSFLPIGIFLLQYQVLEIINVGEDNFDKLVKLATDEIWIEGQDQDIILPKQKTNEISAWIKNYNLGKWRKK